MYSKTKRENIINKENTKEITIRVKIIYEKMILLVFIKN